MIGLYRDPEGEKVFGSTQAGSEHGQSRYLSRSDTVKELKLQSEVEALRRRITQLETILPTAVSVRTVVSCSRPTRDVLLSDTHGHKKLSGQSNDVFHVL